MEGLQRVGLGDGAASRMPRAQAGRKGGKRAGGGGIWNSPGGPNVVTMANAGWTDDAGQSEHGATAQAVEAANGFAQ